MRQKNAKRSGIQTGAMANAEAAKSLCRIGLCCFRYSKETQNAKMSTELKSTGLGGTSPALKHVFPPAVSVALYGGEQDEKRRLTSELENVLCVMRRIVTANTRLTCITAGYGWFTIIAPIVVASPGYFGGDLSFGGLMMVVGAFIQVQQALRWFIDNFSTIADWRATRLRIASFRETVIHGQARRDREPHRVRQIGRRHDELRESGDRRSQGLHNTERAARRYCARANVFSSLESRVAAKPCYFARSRACGLGALVGSRCLRRIA